MQEVSRLAKKMGKTKSIERHIPWVALVAVVVLAAWLRFSNLEALGYANHYYAAAVKSMLESGHNFFFVAAEPGGSVSVDKPPVGLWIQAISAYFLGVNGFAILLPQLLAGMISVVVIYQLVHRSFGVAAGLLAALILAITPVVVATDRNNTIDSTLILALLLAAWAFLKATETGKLRHLMLGAFLVGVGFNIKMLQAILPLPAFYALYFLGSPERVWRKAGKLVLASLLLLVVSLSWAIAVDLTPADQRPYVGSSGNNSETNLILGYNGLNRLIGMIGRRGNPPSPSRLQAGAPPVGSPSNRGSVSPVPGSSNGFPPGIPGRNDTGLPPNITDGSSFAIPPSAPPRGFLGKRLDANNDSLPLQDRPRVSGNQFPGNSPPGGPGGGLSGTGQAGALRLFVPPLSKELSWLLPFGIFSLILISMKARLCWPLTPKHQAVALWGIWLLVGGVFFSVAGFFHEYYLSMLAPPLAALSAIGATQLWRMHAAHPWRVTFLLLLTAGGTLGFQTMTAQAFVDRVWWLPFSLALFAIGLLLLIGAAKSRKLRRAVSAAGYACILVSILLTPGVWSALTTFNASENQSLPSAYGGRSSGLVNRGGLQVNQAMLDYMESNTQEVDYLIAVPSSMQGADYVLATGRPVLYMGGFMGQDQVVDADDLAEMVQQGELRYIYWDARGGGFGNQSSISSWVASTCRAVPGFETATRNMGAPDGTLPGQSGSPNRQNGPFQQGPGNLQIALYDCQP